ncbi:MAG: methyltransferase domain-containing protein [Oceanipulchritudo sp.]
MMDTDQHRNARNYYGKELNGSDDLKTSACCIDTIPAQQKHLLGNISSEILDRFYGCGSPLPSAIEGLTVLDLGCGTGRDVYLAAQLVGPKGRVIGVDMTTEQLDIARKYRDSQAARFGYAEANTEFREATIEDLAAAGIADNSIDLVISNCVINLSPEKDRVFKEIFRVLRPGGELFFADVFADRRLRPELADDPVLHGECLAGALYEEDFRRLLLRQGCPDYRIYDARELEITDQSLKRELGGARFHSRTIRAFKLDGLEDRPEDYGQAVCYRGTVADEPDAFKLDEDHVFEAGKYYPVCGNTAVMLSETRLKQHVKVVGDRGGHFGLFVYGETALSASGDCC